MSETVIGEQQIRERAYQLWLEAGAPEGRDEQFWHQAAQELSEGAPDAALPDPGPAGRPD